MPTYGVNIHNMRGVNIPNMWGTCGTDEGGDAGQFDRAGQGAASTAKGGEGAPPRYQMYPLGWRRSSAAPSNGALPNKVVHSVMVMLWRGAGWMTAASSLPRSIRLSRSQMWRSYTPSVPCRTAASA
eukprot:6672748-Pyramimonas_sp.AAC.4